MTNVITRDAKHRADAGDKAVAKSRILIVDDNPDFRAIFTRKLVDAGFELREAENGEKGIAQMKEWKPDLVLLDMEMPVMNGAETMEKIRADASLSGSKVVFLTNLGEPQGVMADSDERFAEDVGAAGYIKKTADLGRIVNEIENFLHA